MLRHLEGDFALVVWSARQGRLIGVRDPLGGFPLFWAQHDGALAFATSLRPLLAMLPRCDLDSDYLADYLALPGCAVAEVGSERCVYQGVRRVPAGSVVALDSATGAVRHQANWDWLEHAEDPGSDRLEEIAAEVGQRLHRAVRERLCGASDAYLSGGTGLLAFDAFASAPLSDEPCPNLAALAAEQAMVEEAARAGAATLLTGLGADEMLDAPPYHITDLLRRGRWLAAWREAGRWARAENTGLWQVLWPYGLASLVPTFLQGGLGALLRGGHAGWQQQNNATLPPWLRRDFARRHRLHGRVLAHVHRYRHACRSAGLSAALAAIAGRIGDSTRWLLAAPRGLMTAHPFLDTRLLRFGLGVRARVRPAPGRYRPILAEALRGTVPDEVRNRPGKGDFNETDSLGLRRNMAQLEALVLEAPVECQDWLDRDALLRCLYQAGLGVAPNAIGMDRLSLTLSLLHWLSRQDEWQRRTAPVTRVLWWGGPNSAVAAPGARTYLAPLGSRDLLPINT